MTHELPRPDVDIPIQGGPFERPDPEIIDRLRKASSATVTARLHHLGVRQTFIQGPVAQFAGTHVIGPAVTLQFMPQREDVASGWAQEEVEKRSALWAVMEAIQPGDILAVQAYGDPYSGCLGEMLMTYCKGRGGAGVVVDGYIRDWPRVKEIGLPLWCRGFTPHYASQSSLYPWAYNVPIACSRVLVLPGDIILADEDGAVLIPRKLAGLLADKALEKEAWEHFSRMKLAEGGALSKYYPLSDEGWQEYEAWAKANNHHAD